MLVLLNILRAVLFTPNYAKLSTFRNCAVAGAVFASGAAARAIQSSDGNVIYQWKLMWSKIGTAVS